jgi:hypothetical protein
MAAGAESRESVMRSALVGCSIAVLLTIGAISVALPQQSTPGVDIRKESERLYADAHPYMDDPLPELKRVGRELGGIRPDPSPAPLPALLQRVGSQADQLLQKIPDLISDEAVRETQYSQSQGLVAGCVGEFCGLSEKSPVRDQMFNYLILTHPAHGGQLVLQEYRTNRNGKVVQPGTGSINFEGFISAWIVFSSANQVESRFRYLGQQQTDGHSTFVIGFAQVPGSVESPGVIVASRESVPMLLQGIAWIDQADFRIVRLRTDLLAPLPEFSIQKQTANILFGAVRIAEINSELWLPQVVHVEMESRGQVFEEQHKYSKYRLYKAKSKIILYPGS